MKGFYLGLAIGVPLLVILAAVEAMPLTGVIMFVPGWIGAIGYLQAKNKFCVGYAASGVYNNSDEYAKTAKIIEEASRKLDKKRARKINTQSLAYGLATAIVSVVILAVIQSM